MFFSCLGEPQRRPAFPVGRAEPDHCAVRTHHRANPRSSPQQAPGPGAGALPRPRRARRGASRATGRKGQRLARRSGIGRVSSASRLERPRRRKRPSRCGAAPRDARRSRAPSRCLRRARARSALAADHAQNEQRNFEAHHLERRNANPARRPRHLLAAACQPVERRALVLERRVHRRHLLAAEAFQHLQSVAAVTPTGFLQGPRPRRRRWRCGCRARASPGIPCPHRGAARRTWCLAEQREQQPGSERVERAMSGLGRAEQLLRLLQRRVGAH